MRALKPRDGAPVPLFDRLTDTTPGVDFEPVPLRMHGPEALRASVRDEILTLLSTRAPDPEHVLDGRQRSVVDYGLADISHYFTRDRDDTERLARSVARTIAAYEPRLRKVAVRIDRMNRQHRSLEITIEGEIRIGRMVEPVSFPVSLEASGGG